MKILNQVEHSLLNRKQLDIELEHKGNKTPKKEDVLKEISSLLKVEPELIKIKAINTKYGGNFSRIIVNLYSNLENLKKIEEFRKKPKKKKEKKAPAKK
jgi:ribosomal protein S24E